MKYSVMLLAAVAATASAQSQDENPGSLWNNKAPSPYQDRVARKEGDVITIVISETSTSAITASTNTSKTDSNNITKGLGPILSNLIPNWMTGNNASNSGQGQTSQTGRFSATVSAVVRKVLPNGTMIIEGTKLLTVNKDTQTFTVRGIIRPDDIRSDNTVLSERIADAYIVGNGKGQIADRQRRGILTRLLDWLF